MVITDNGARHGTRAQGQILTGFCFLCVKLTALKKLTLSQRPEHIYLRTPSKTGVLVLILLT